MRPVIIPGSRGDFLPMIALPQFGYLFEGGLLRRFCLLGVLKLVKQLFRVAVIQNMGSGLIGVLGLIAPILAEGEHGSVVYLFCHF